MAKKSNRAKPKPKDSGRRTKKKVSVLTTEKIDYVDYKDVNLLKKFVSDRSKVRARRVTGNDTQQQAEVARAIKNAREMALIPYATKVTTQRGGRGERGRRDDGGGRRGPDGPSRDDRGSREPTAADAPPTEDATDAAAPEAPTVEVPAPIGEAPVPAPTEEV